MLITLSTSGGIGGFGLGGKEKTVETDGLEAPLRQKVCDRFDPAVLAKLQLVDPGHSGSADRITYHVVVKDDKGERHRFDIPEAALPAEMLDLIDEM
jgi:hypothetical protein